MQSMLKHGVACVVASDKCSMQSEYFHNAKTKVRKTQVYMTFFTYFNVYIQPLKRGHAFMNHPVYVQLYGR